MDFEQARARMVEEQIARRGVRDPRVIDALGRVPRHEFVAAGDQSVAYTDRALPIELGQTISQPYMVALMTEALRLPERAHVLEVGTGSGYQAAVLSLIVADVVSIERHEPLADTARARLARLGLHNVNVVIGDGTRGWSLSAPYDGIVVTAGAPVVPDALRQQLADGARLVIPVGSAVLQHLTVVTRRGEQFDESAHAPCAFVPLIGAEGWPDARAPKPGPG
jgi:protein-L-isoaspartate(D-aspartate) O-methyltransferase